MAWVGLVRLELMENIAVCECALYHLVHWYVEVLVPV